MSEPANYRLREANLAHRLVRNSLHVALLAAVTAASSTLHAQQAPASAADTAPIQEIVVTGSYIRRTQTESSNPVQIITAEEMKASGYTSTQQVLQSLTANGQGQLSQSNPGAFAEGATGISLRGLTVAYTLVLIDGHRTAPYPIGDDGQRTFVDVANLPFDAVDHIEVLKDGASAIYGSDAIAGVVNIILKKTYQGGQVTGEGGITDHDDGSNFHVSGIWGLGDLDSDGHNFYLSAEFRKQNPIYFTERGGIFTNLDYTSQGGTNQTYGAGNIINGFKQPLASGYILDPTSGAIAGFMPGCSGLAAFNANQCTYPDTWSQIQPATANTNLTGRFTQKFASDWQASLDVGYFDSKSQQYNHPEETYISQAYGGFQGVTSGPGVVPTLLTPVPAITIPSTNPSFPTGANLLEPGLTSGVLAAAFTGLGPNGSAADDTDAQTYRAVANLDGKIGEWDVNIAGGYTEVDLGIDFLGYPQYANLQTALDSTTDPYLVGQVNSAALNNFVAPPEHSDNSSKLVFGHAGATRPLVDLNGGPMSVAFGGDYYTRDQYGVAPLAEAEGLYPSGYISNNFAVGKQYVYSGYLELDAPIVKQLDVDVAGRYDHYNLSGGKASPKIGFKYTPIDQFAFRGTAAKGFRAPDPQENGEAGQTFYSAATNDPILCPNPGTATAPGNFVGQCTVTLPTLQGTNPLLKPETSKTFTLGFRYEPSHDFSASWDLYYIEIDNQIVSGGPTTTIRGTSLAPLLEYQPGGGTALETPPVGQIAYFTTSYINANSTKTSGYDLEFDYHHRFDWLDFKSVAMWSYEYRYSIEVDGITYQLAGTHGPSGTGGDTGNPRSHVQWVNTATIGAFSLTGTMNFVSSFNIVDPVSEALSTSGFEPQENCLEALDFGGAAAYDFANELGAGQIPNQSMCRVAHYITFDLYARYDLNEHLNIHGSVQNVFNEKAPLDWETYGGAIGLVPWNSANNLEGAIGTSFMVGATYKF